MRPRPAVPRLLGALTAAYSLAVVVKPAVLAKPCGLAEADGSVAPHVAAPVRAVSTRDAIISVGMVLVPAGVPLQLLSIVRGCCDISDAAVFGLPVKDPKMRRNIMAVGATWGTLCVLASRLA